MTSKELEKIILQDGWYFDYANSSHRHYKHKTKKGKVTCPAFRKNGFKSTFEPNPACRTACVAAGKDGRFHGETPAEAKTLPFHNRPKDLKPSTVASVLRQAQIER